jgi:hypothetical protein
MQARAGVVVIVGALIVAAGIAAHGGRYEVVSGGPESAYLVNRWTGQTWYLTGATSRLVKPAIPDLQKEFQKP